MMTTWCSSNSALGPAKGTTVDSVLSVIFRNRLQVISCSKITSATNTQRHYKTNGRWGAVTTPQSRNESVSRQDQNSHSHSLSWGPSSEKKSVFRRQYNINILTSSAVAIGFRQLNKKPSSCWDGRLMAPNQSSWRLRSSNNWVSDGKNGFVYRHIGQP